MRMLYFISAHVVLPLITAGILVFYCCDKTHWSRAPKDQSSGNNCFTAECNSRPYIFCSLQPPAHINTHAYIKL